MSEQASIAKITRPRLSGIGSRDRLFHLLDKGLKKPVNWVAAPAGSGKTTLVASWLDSRRLPCLWYQVDEGDGDLATFFYYMGLAVKKTAPRHKKPLPLLTPEYLQGIPTFTRRYFENLFSLLKTPFTIVLDNYQDVPLQSGFHEMIAHALDITPEGVTIIVVSRAEPPAQLSRLKANNKIDFIGWNEIRFTFDESSTLMEAHGRGKLTEEARRQLYEKTEGWAAGLVLMTQDACRSGFGAPPSLNTQREVFEYFASEIFNKSDKLIQDVLLKTAFLPKIDAAVAEKLTGIDSVEQILDRLSRNHYFTQKYMQVYQYHPLFREFILMRAHNTFSSNDLSLIQRKAAGLLADSGNIEDAASLLRDAKDWEGLTKLILFQARTLVAQGRSKTLEEWISGIPEEMIEKAPWILYWLGICRMAYNPAEARGCFEKAYMLFKKDRELSGVFLVWSAIVDTFVYEWGDFKPLDHWIAEMEGIIAENPGFPSQEIEVRVAAGMLSAMTNRQPGRSELPQWAERVERIVLMSHNVPFKVMLGNTLIFYYLWVRDFSKIAVLIDALRPSAGLKGYDPLTLQAWYVMEAMYSWFVADWMTCRRAIADGLRNAEESGVHLLDFYLLAQGVYGGLSLGDPSTAESCLEKMLIINSPRIGDKALYQYQASSVAWYHGDFKKSEEHGRQGVKICEEMGWPDADGDAAHSTFKSNLHRLRQLIENDDALTIKEGRVTLDPRYCWVDVWAFRRILADVEGVGGEKIREAVEKGVNIYNGDFLAGDKGLSWAVSLRERLKGGLIRLVKMSGQNYINAGEWEEAIRLYQKALEINDLEEEFYKALMLCYGKLGRRADVQTTYHRLRKLLASVLAVEPSPETKAIYNKAMTV